MGSRDTGSCGSGHCCSIWKEKVASMEAGTAAAVTVEMFRWTGGNELMLKDSADGGSVSFFDMEAV